jgi:hypothetical protein
VVTIDSDSRVLEVAFMMLSHPLQRLIPSSTALVDRQVLLPILVVGLLQLHSLRKPPVCCLSQPLCYVSRHVSVVLNR